MLFTNTDRVLVLRAARILREQAAALENAHGQNWVLDKESRAAKQEYNRLLRDERDLKMLVKRIEKEQGPFTRRPNKINPTAPLPLGGQDGNPSPAGQED